jgi:uncharacterized protein (TIGR02444 family)
MTQPSEPARPTAAARPNPFWDFSLRLYASPAVQRACLELQDGSGVDVNVLLYMLWQASLGRHLTADDARALLAVVEPWRVDVVVPLRTARRNLKLPSPAFEGPAADALRAIVKKAELEAERLQQATLHAFVPPSTGLATGMATGMATAMPTPVPADAPVRACAEANTAAYSTALARPLAVAPLGVMLDALEAITTAP